MKEYLGDGVYAIYDGYGIWLHANDLENPTDRVYLEPKVFNALKKFEKRISEVSDKIN
jgi:predicted component of type VI protein secretion system